MRENLGEGKGAVQLRLPAACNAWDGFRAKLSTDARMAKKKKASKKKGWKSPIGDRVQFLTMMSPDVIVAVKQAAIEDERAAWAVMEEAAREWLERRKKAK
jgi:hypothetical protein